MKHAPTPDVEVVWKPIPGSSQEIALDSRADVTLYTGARGPGKCLPVETPVPTPLGWQSHGSLRPGDTVFGATGRLIKVVGAFAPTMRDVYRITFNDGTSIEASDNHLWTLTVDRGVPRNWRTGDTLELKSRCGKGYPTRLPPRPCVDYPEHYLPLDPYILGAWTGDGSTSVRIRQPTGNRTVARKGYSIEFGSADSELVSAFVHAGFTIKRSTSNFTWLSGKAVHRAALRDLGLFETKSETKFVPEHVLLNSPAVRLAYLQGLADTDGTPRIGATGASISTVSKRLADGVGTLVRSLGGMSRISCYTPKEHQRAVLPIYKVHFSLPDDVPFRLSRKIAVYKKPQRLGWFCPSVTSVTLVGKKAVSCVEVDAADHLYVAGSDYIVTHNTDTQIMYFRRLVGIGYGQFMRGVIFDQEYKQLDDIISKTKRWFPRFNDGARFLESASSYKWVWPTGEELLFRVGSTEQDYWSYHGQEFPYIGFNELCKYASSRFFDMMFACNRSSFIPPADSNIPPIPLKVFATANPYGPGHTWVKQRFIDVAPLGKMVRTPVKVFDPKTQENVAYERTQIAIHGSYRENIYLDKQYVSSLESVTDPNLRKAWLDGDWDIVAGGAISDLWQRSLHVMPRMQIPKTWRIDRALDWGSSHPFAVGWFAEANGEEAIGTTPDGRSIRFCPPPGTLVQIAEEYGAERVGLNQGKRLSAGDVADLVKRKEQELRDGGWINGPVWPGPADNQIRDVRESDVDTIEKKMADKGVRWTESDKSPGSRRNGLQLLRDRLLGSIRNEGPGLYFMDNCVASIATIPTLPRDPLKPDDVDTKAEDHAYDMVRYRVLAGNNRAATRINVQMPI